MLRGRSSDRIRKVTPPGPVYMSNDQFADYLKDLRNNRIARPSGARPLPSSNSRDSQKRMTTDLQPDKNPEPTSLDEVPRSSSALSHRRNQSSLSTYSSVTSRKGRQLVQYPKSGSPVVPLNPSEVVPSAIYIERGQRWMEKEEAVSLREAMEDMDTKKEHEEEARLHVAAQHEASELVWQHQHPEAATQRELPYRYKDHLRKNSYQHARTQSVGRCAGAGMITGLARDIAPRSVSSGSTGSGGMSSPRGRVSSERSCHSQLDQSTSPDLIESASVTSPNSLQKPYGSITGASRSESTSWRRTCAKRNVSGEIASTFTGDQIWEEPEQESGDRGRPQQSRDTHEPLHAKPRNPLNRVKFVQDLGRSSSTPPETIKKLCITEIHRNPPSQSRNPNYTANPLAARQVSDPKPAGGVVRGSQVSTKDGLEIRSDEIRQATSMRFKDRSPKLPTPAVVSNKPGRPIVSFDANWKPKEADIKPEVRRRSPFDRRSFGSPKNGLPFQQDAKDVSSPVTTAFSSDSPLIQVCSPDVTVPNINLPDRRASPALVGSVSPTSTVHTLTDLPASSAPIPSFTFSETPSISISAPQISIESPAKDIPRPLPDPTKVGGRSQVQPRTNPISRSHWTPAAGSRATATCHQCHMPIEGRVLNLKGAAERFHPHCFICFTCGTGLESLEIHTEPDPKRKERLDRIKRREQGEEINETEGQTVAEDGDARLRYYCHLDWHENFAPRCKHCTTPIIGEHTIALGEHWHYGHFFCAECGDPFEKGMSHIEKDGYAWCLPCQTKRTERRAPKCRKCQQPVIGQYVQALGGEWHDKCFQCATCRRSFDDGSFYPKENEDGVVVLCVGCIERELKA